MREMEGPGIMSHFITQETKQVVQQGVETRAWGGKERVWGNLNFEANMQCQVHMTCWQLEYGPRAREPCGVEAGAGGAEGQGAGVESESRRQLWAGIRRALLFKDRQRRRRQGEAEKQ